MSGSNRVLSALLLSVAMSVSAFADEIDNDERRPTNKGVDLRSHGRQVADQVREQRSAAPPEAGGRGDRGSPEWREPEDRRDRDDLDAQVNDAALDHVQTIPNNRPFEFSIQSETSIAVFRDHIVIGYNSSARQALVQTPIALVLADVQFSGFSVSHDRGRTWTSGFVPPVPGSPYTFGDPSVGVDRAGRFYYVSLGTGAAGPGFARAVIINTSTDGGATFAPATIVALDDGSDKPWLAVGRDPADKKRDNLYVAWTSFQGNRSELRFARSIDGGTTWSPQQTLVAPVDTGPGGTSAFVHFATPTVDRSTGRLFIPFLHLSNRDADFIKVLVSDDAGDTFTVLELGAPDTAGFSNVTPGILSDCGPVGGIRPVLGQGADLKGGRGNPPLPRFRQSTRLITQPSAAAAGGRLFVAFNASTSEFFGDPNSRSEIRLLFSPDGGRTVVGPFTVAAATDADPQHVLPSVSVDEDGHHVSVAYYVQQADGQIRVDLTSAKVTGGGRRVQMHPPARVSRVAFDLVPSNNPLPRELDPFFTTNYDRTIVPCYDLGEYLSITDADDGLFAAWGDNRNPWTAPPGSPTAGPHAQPDVFFRQMER